MFTGLVAALGAVAIRESRGPGARLGLQCAALLGDRREGCDALVLGESIAVDGCCLSVARIVSDGFEVDASAETLACTTLGGLAPGAAVNLERSVALGDRLGGHLVTGHVDGVGRVVDRRPVGEGATMAFELAPELARFVARKGSIAVNGVSLTVNAVSGPRFEVALIPVTLAATNLGRLAPGQAVNIEVDLVARYVARLLEAGDPRTSAGSS